MTAIHVTTTSYAVPRHNHVLCTTCDTVSETCVTYLLLVSNHLINISIVDIDIISISSDNYRLRSISELSRITMYHGACVTALTH